MDWSVIDFEKAANGILILVTGLLGYFGIRRGLRAPSRSQENDGHTVEVAGALVDSAAVRQLSGEVTGQAIAFVAQISLTRAIKPSITMSSVGSTGTICVFVGLFSLIVLPPPPVPISSDHLGARHR